MIYQQNTIGIAMPTESEWGRLYKFNTTGDAGLICPFRSYYFRDFIAGGWTDISIGMIHAEMGNSGDISNLNAERLSEFTPSNLFHFGLTQSISGTIPVTFNPWFIGLRGILGGVTQIMTSPLQLAQLFVTCIQNYATETVGETVQVPLSQGISASPFSRLGIRFIYDIVNSRIHVNFAADTGIALADDAANITNLQTFLNGISGSITSSFAFFSCPDISHFQSFYMFWPYLTNRIKLHCVGVLKNA